MVHEELPDDGANVVVYDYLIHSDWWCNIFLEQRILISLQTNEGKILLWLYIMEQDDVILTVTGTDEWVALILAQMHQNTHTHNTVLQKSHFSGHILLRVSITALMNEVIISDTYLNTVPYYILVHI